MKASQGLFQGNMAPYGYIKDPENKNKLIIDENVADIVRRIFDLYIKGNSGYKIAKMLTTEKITSPCKYLKIPLYKNSFDQWSGKTVVRMISNVTYIGDMVGLKTRRVGYKIDKCVRNKSEDQFIIQGTHAPIVSKEVFKQANIVRDKSKKIRVRKHDDVLKGLMYCGECGSVMTLKVKVNNNGINGKDQHSFMCVQANKSRPLLYKKCENSKTISSPKVYSQLVHLLQKEFDKLKISDSDIENTLSNISKGTNTQKSIIDRKIIEIGNKIDELESQIDDLYKDKVKKIISIDDFSRIYENVQREKKEFIKKLEDLQKDHDNNKEINVLDVKKIKNMLREFLACEEPNKEFLFRLIDRIEMDKNKKIKIKCFFHNDVES